MIILGLSGAHDHDAAAAILVDGEIVAAVEEERLVRQRRAPGQMPIEAARYCLHAAGITAKEIDAVALPSASVPFIHPRRWRHARRNLRSPDVALSALFDGDRAFRRSRLRTLDAGRTLGINWARTRLVPVDHHLAHASSSYHASGFAEKTAILVMDGSEHATTFFGYGEGGRIHQLHELYAPDSPAGLYGVLARVLGANGFDDESAVMTLALAGDPGRVDLSRLVDRSIRGQPRVDGRHVRVRRGESTDTYVVDGALIGMLEELRGSASVSDADIAASIQQLFESLSLELLETHLGDIIRATGRLAFAGGGAFNTSLNRRILERGDVAELFVPPAAGDAGSALGAAMFVASEAGEPLRRMQNARLGPGFTTRECIEALEARVGRPRWRMMKDVPKETAALLAAGNPVTWFQGRMEFGPRAIGSRSILGRANAVEIVDRIRTQLGSDGRGRPFCASVLDRVAGDALVTPRPTPFMTTAFSVKDAWKPRLSAVLAADGSAIVQIVERDANVRFYEMLQALEGLTGDAAVLGSPLYRDADPIACSPDDALALFYESDLEYLVMEDILVTKEGE